MVHYCTLYSNGNFYILDIRKRKCEGSFANKRQKHGERRKCEGFNLSADDGYMYVETDLNNLYWVMKKSREVGESTKLISTYMYTYVE